MQVVGKRWDEPLVGRAVELRRVRAWLADGPRLLSVCGAPGVGKSRLLLEACADGCPAVRIDLFGSRDPAAAAARIDAARAEGEEAPLLLIDNLGVVDAAVRAAIHRRLEAGSRVLASAPGALGLEGELVLELDPLPLQDAVELLRLRAAVAGSDLARAEAPTLRAIAAALDRNPLALELAAFQLGHLDPGQLEARLCARLELLERPPAPAPFGRHHRLRDAIAAAWAALDPGAARHLARLAVFCGGFEADAAGAVLDLHDEEVEVALDALRGRSLLRRDGCRHRLEASVRIFAARMLDPAERLAAERAHAAFFLPRAAAWGRAVEQRADTIAADRLEREMENLLEIHRRALQRPSRPEAVAMAIEVALALESLLAIRGDTHMLLRVLDAALAATSPARTDAILRARALQARGRARLLLGRPAGAHTDLVEAAGLARAARDTSLEALALLLLARVHREQSRHEEARACIERALALLEGSEDDPLRSRALMSHALLAFERGEREAARISYERALAVQERCGDRRGWAISSGTIGRLLCDSGRVEEGRARIEMAISVLRTLGDDANEAALLSFLAIARQDAGDLAGACADLERALRLARAAGRRRFEGQLAFELGGALLEAGALDRAAGILDEALAILRGLGDVGNEGRCLLLQAALLARVGSDDRAAAALERGEQLLRALDAPDGAGLLEATRGVLAAELSRCLLEAGETVGARIHLQEALRRQAAAGALQAAGNASGRVLLRLLAGAVEQIKAPRVPLAANG